MEQNQKAQALLVEARTLLAGGDLAAAKAKRAEAENILAQIEEERAIADAEKRYSPIRPDLPGTGSGAMPQVVEDKGNKSGGVAVADEDEDDGGDLSWKTQKAAYVTRFGDEESIVKGILTDLHGKNYQGSYWAQKAAFNKYLRGGESALASDDRKMLRGLVMTPKAIKMALDQGVDDLQSFRATMVEAADTLGGFLVPVDFQMRMIEQLARLTVVRGRASQMNTSRDRVELPEATGADGIYTSPVRVTWVDETPTVGQLTPNYLTFGLRGINVHTAMAETPLSRNLLEDIAFDVEAYLARKLSEAVAVDEDKQFLIGNGVGKPHGILPGSINGNSIQQVVSGDANTVLWNGLIDMTFKILAQYRVNGAWYANKSTYATIAKLQEATSKEYLWNPFQFVGGNVDARGNKTLLGYPVVESEWLPDIAANAFPILFGDMGAYQIVDRLGMTVERYLDSQTARQNLVYFVMRRRLGGELIETWKLAVQKIAAS